MKGVKFMRLPSGFGLITKRGEEYKKRYWARVPCGSYVDKVTGKIKENRKSVGFFKTREEALHAIEKYHREKGLLTRSDVTVSEVYDKWCNEKFPIVRDSTVYTYEHAFELCKSLHKRRISELRLYDLQEVIDNSDKNYPTIKTMKILMTQLFDFEMKYDLVLKNYATYVDIAVHKDKNPNKMIRNKFTYEQVDILWKNAYNKYDWISLMLIYSGVRISELLDLKKVNVHLEEQYFFIEDSKTHNGIRNVPIHDRTLPFFKEWYNSSPKNCQYLLYDRGFSKLTYSQYLKRYYRPLMNKLDITHTPHCCRHTCISMMSERGVDPMYIKLIVGHSGALSITEKVYIHVDIKDLVRAINQI